MTLRASLTPIVCAALFCGGGAAQDEAPPKIVTESSFYVAGYSVRTNNADEATGRGRIGDLWRRFQGQGLAATIPDRIGDDLIVVYSDYASDEHGEYNYLLGVRVSSVRNLPTGMEYCKVAAGPYAVFQTKGGPASEVVPAEWKTIWRISPEEMGGRRAFVTDYEVYGKDKANPRGAQVAIHIGLKPGQ